jgi:hypothetical protein
MAGKTLADHSRAYRTRKAERIARMEAALDNVKLAYVELVEKANQHYNDGIISYAELKTAVNTAAFIRNAAFGIED